MVAERVLEDHRPEEAHLQAVAGRVRRAGGDRAHLPEKSIRRTGLCSWRRSQGKFKWNTYLFFCF